MASVKIIQKYNHSILYDSSVLNRPDEELFDPDWLTEHAKIQEVGFESATVEASTDQSMAMGRGAAWFVEHEGQHWVLKHYRRGGLMAKWNKSHYLSCSLTNNRAWREWYLLNSLFSLGLPVPQPIAAQVRWPFGRLLFIYQAAIIIKRIPNAMTLAEKCQQQSISPQDWLNVGRCIKDFHQRGVYHADLNANNILFAMDNKVYLIDFDKGRIRRDGAWKVENINRLQRSLIKLQSQYKTFSFSEENWQSLVASYQDAA